jgi:DNA polymerase-4
MAEQIRQRIFAELKITVSAGVSVNKFIAKVASDWRKPNGLTVVTPDRIAAFIHALPVKRIFGVGKVTAAKLQQLGVSTCADLQCWNEVDLCHQFGSLGTRLFQLCRGIDEREVVSEWRRKSVSVEHTYAEDLPSVDHCLSQLPCLYSSLLQRMEGLDKGYRIAKAFVKVKFADFQTTTMERIGTSVRISDFRNLCVDAVQRQSTPVRLLGLGVRLLDHNQGEQRQLKLFPENELS